MWGHVAVLASENRFGQRTAAILMLTSLVLLLYVPSSNAVAEPPLPQWSRTYPRSVNYTVNGYPVSVGGDEGLSVVQTVDGGYAIIADVNDHHYEPHSGGVDNHTSLIIKTDSLGNVEWEKGYLTIAYPHSIFQTKDLGFVISGNKWILKLDAEGNEQWSKKFDSYFIAIQAKDGGYVLAGSIDAISVDDNIANLIKTDANGNLLWNKTYREYPSWSRANAIVETEDGGYAIAGQQGSAWFGITDSDGNLKVSQMFPELEGTFNSIARTEDDGFVLVGGNQIGGINNPSQGIIAKVDSQGMILWNHSYNNPPNVGFWFLSIAQTADGGYIGAGYSSALFRMDAYGDLEWYFSSSTDVSDVLGSTNSVTATKDGGFAVVGSKKGGAWLAKFAAKTTTNTTTEATPTIISVISPEKNAMYNTGDIPLTVTVNNPTSWIRYSLDGQANPTMTGNTTLTGLSNGNHIVIIYANDTSGNIRASGAISFNVTAQFPTTLAAVAVIAAVAIIAVVILYFKKNYAIVKRK